MPQTSIIRADGTGDYTTLQSWALSERGSSYGSPAVALIDGWFDLGAARVDVDLGFVDGIEMRPFDPSHRFDGTVRMLTGVTSTVSTGLFFSRGQGIFFDGLELLNTGDGGVLFGAAASNNLVRFDDCLAYSVTGVFGQAAIRNNAVDLTLNNTVVTSGGDLVESFTGKTTTINNSTMWARSSKVFRASTGAIIIKDSFLVNDSASATIPAGSTQSNNATSDGLGDALTFVDKFDVFFNPTPVASGDYRISSSSTVGQIGIGAFVFSAGNNYTFGLDSISFTSSLTNVTFTIEEVGSLDLSGVTVGFVDSGVTTTFAPNAITTSFK